MGALIAVLWTLNVRTHVEDASATGDKVELGYWMGVEITTTRILIWWLCAESCWWVVSKWRRGRGAEHRSDHNSASASGH